MAVLVRYLLELYISSAMVSALVPMGYKHKDSIFD